MALKDKFQVPIVVAVLVAIFGLIYLFGAQLGMIGGYADYLFSGIVSSESYLREIEAKRNLSDVYDAYYTLGERKDPIALEVALQDIHSDDAYLWVNAGQYLGVLGREEATPYLIKALRHTAWRSDEERVALLQQITGQNFGNDFETWKTWWVAENPDSEFNWSSSLGARARIDKIPANQR